MPHQVLDVTQDPYSAVPGTEATASIQVALNDAVTLAERGNT